MRERQVQFTDLHNRLYGKLFSFVNLRVRDKEEVKDIVSDVFLKAFSSFGNMEQFPDETTARNYLFHIARQRMIDVWRSARHRLQTDLLNTKYDSLEGNTDDHDQSFDELPSELPLPEEMFESDERREQAVLLLSSLNDLERELMVLRFLNELEYRELAEIYETTEDNIRQKVSRALQKLRKNKGRINK